MNIGGIPLAAANLAGQAAPPKGIEAERQVREAAMVARAERAAHRAEAAADVGETSDDVTTGDGEADGRQLLDGRPLPNGGEPADEFIAEESADPVAGESIAGAPDPTGELGNELDLQG